MRDSSTYVQVPNESVAGVSGRTAGLWTIILAAGEGSRLAEITRGTDGVPVPKQFCSLDGRQSILRAALERAGHLAPPSRQLVVVAAHHERWWRPELAHLPPENVLVQPVARGTAAGLLLPALESLRRDASARLVVLPSDHHVNDEATIERALWAASAASRTHAGCLVLLGIEPDRPDSGYGWIVREPGVERVGRIARFVEKPDHARAVELMEQGALWSSFMLCCDAASLLRCFDRAAPSLLRALTGAASPESLRAAYAGIPCLDFSRDVLETCADQARVLSVPACGWTDLGTTERVANCLGLSGPIVERARAHVRAVRRVGCDLPEADVGPSRGRPIAAAPGCTTAKACAGGDP